MTETVELKPLSRPSSRKEFMRLAIGYTFLTLAIVAVAFEIWVAHRRIEVVKELEQSSVSYTYFRPQRTEYKAGEVVSFDFERIATVDNYPLLLLIIDSFENLDTGEIYPGEIGARIVWHDGTDHRRASRVLPTWCSTGTYVLQGWSSSQTNRLTRASYYVSFKFHVTATQNPPERPATGQLMSPSPAPTSRKMSPARKQPNRIGKNNAGQKNNVDKPLEAT